MKLKQLYRTVSLLGFGRSQNRIPIEDFITATNLAAESINAIAPLIGNAEYTLNDAEDAVKDNLIFDASGYYNSLCSPRGKATMCARCVKVIFSGGKVLVPASLARNCNDKSLPLTVKYYRKPTLVTDESFDANAELDVSPDAAHLVPYLVASHLFADEEPELSEIYLEFYEKHADKLSKVRTEGDICGGSTFDTWFSEGEGL